jgi:hypothetical protein
MQISLAPTSRDQESQEYCASRYEGNPLLSRDLRIAQCLIHIDAERFPKVAKSIEKYHPGYLPMPDFHVLRFCAAYLADPGLCVRFKNWIETTLANSSLVYPTSDEMRKTWHYYWSFTYTQVWQCMQQAAYGPEPEYSSAPRHCEPYYRKKEPHEHDVITFPGFSPRATCERYVELVRDTFSGIRGNPGLTPPLPIGVTLFHGQGNLEVRAQRVHVPIIFLHVRSLIHNFFSSATLAITL